MVSSGHSGFLHHQKLKKIWISLIIGSSDEGFRSRDERKSGLEKCKI
jgi:hypothetical protein